MHVLIEDYPKEISVNHMNNWVQCHNKCKSLRRQRWQSSFWTFSAALGVKTTTFKLPFLIVSLKMCFKRYHINFVRWSRLHVYPQWCSWDTLPVFSCFDLTVFLRERSCIKLQLVKLHCECYCSFFLRIRFHRKSRWVVRFSGWITQLKNLKVVTKLT